MDEKLKPERHGWRHTRLYNTWDDMKKRCFNQNCPNYKWYGARGITMCDEWCNSFVCFRDWALSSGYNDELTIDRVDVNGNYDPNNCRWVTIKEQANNKRTNRYLTFQGETHTITEWAQKLNVNRKTMWDRIARLGWSVERALTTPSCTADARQQGHNA